MNPLCENCKRSCYPHERKQNIQNGKCERRVPLDKRRNEPGAKKTSRQTLEALFRDGTTIMGLTKNRP